MVETGSKQVQSAQSRSATSFTESRDRCSIVSSSDLLLRKLLLTRKEVASLLAVPEDTITNLHRVRLLPGVKVGKHLRWRPDAVRRFVDGLNPDD